jgi:hypothetical protein
MPPPLPHTNLCLLDHLRSAQALDKIRYMALTDADALGEGETRELDIKVSGCP